MQLSVARMIEGLHEVFPDCAGMSLSAESQLGELPEWDSMAAVNLQAFLLQQYAVEVPLDLLADQTCVSELVAFLENPIASEATS